ncbi:squalene synthase HpnC [Limnoglobus roseus]|uniref:Squalene synthase HpnC n=1 Tax=Limnoglobus roseus TaxID=2598579 RepID=A0A5C1AES4_9BACT|nr:squalene synthase HpnC [Limnoglobus roseus]QEL17270.1 squalene synthase HpnC [Limnoglobus roseus]
MGWNFADELQRWGPQSPGLANPGLSHARSYCASVTHRHYENFTVASVLLPRKLLPHFHAVYAYCRWADDLADETAGGDSTLALLDWWRHELLAVYNGQPRHPVMIALRETVQKFAIPPAPFLNLLTAFEQDQRKKTYATFDELLGYCRNSANPVGELVLYQFECHDAERAALSDEVCTGLQLANFWQDVGRDLDIGRVYLPEEDRRRFGYADEDLHARRFTPAFAELMRFEVDRTRDYFERGKRLLPLIPRQVRIDVDLFIRGGEATLAAVERQGYDVWKQRPKVSKWQKVKLLGRALTSSVSAAWQSPGG